MSSTVFGFFSKVDSIVNFPLMLYTLAFTKIFERNSLMKFDIADIKLAPKGKKRNSGPIAICPFWHQSANVSLKKNL